MPTINSSKFSNRFCIKKDFFVKKCVSYKKLVAKTERRIQSLPLHKVYKYKRFKMLYESADFAYCSGTRRGTF